MRIQHPSTKQICATIGVHAGMNILASVRRSGVPLGWDAGMPVLRGCMLALALLPSTCKVDHVRKTVWLPAAMYD